MKLQLGDTGRILVSLYAPTVIMSLGQGMVVPTIPALAADFDVSAGLAAQLVTAGMIGRVIVLLPVGHILDRYGRKPVLAGGPLLVAAASCLTAVAPFFPLLLLAQLLTGMGTSAWAVAREVAAVDVVRPEQRGRMISGFHGMNSVGVAVGPVFGGLVTDNFGFRAVFWAYALLAVATLVVSSRIGETATAKSAPSPSQGEGRRRGGGGQPGARAVAPRRKLSVGRLSEVEPYFRSTYVVLVANTFVAMMRGALIVSLVPLYVGLQLGYSSTEVGTLFAIYGLVNVLMIAPTGLLLDKAGRKWVVGPSTYIATFVFLVFPLANGMGQLSVLLALTGVATGLALGSMATYTYDIVPEEARARLQTLRRFIGEAGAIAGPALAGVVADAASPSAAFWAFVPLQLVAALLITFVAKESLHRVRARRAGGMPMP